MSIAIAIFLLIISFPIWISICILILITSGFPVLFKQKRMGKNKKVFTIYKFRTMVGNAEELQSKYAHINEADGPVFKIHSDPRYTKVGKFLSHIGLDELPQLINIIKGEMVFVGPRPLPVEEAKKLPKKYSARFSVLPGITSFWVIKGSHKMSFDKWMQLDIQYSTHYSSFSSFYIGLQSIKVLITLLFNECRTIFCKE